MLSNHNTYTVRIILSLIKTFILQRSRSGPCIDYFYSLKNVSFCAFHPRDHRYLGFITKHPTLQRFACHVFRGSESTRPVAEAVGWEVLLLYFYFRKKKCVLLKSKFFQYLPNYNFLLLFISSLSTNVYVCTWCKFSCK